MQPGDLKSCPAEMVTQALARLDEAREGWSTSCDPDSVCVLRLETVEQLEAAARAYLRAAPALPPVPEIEALVERLNRRTSARPSYLYGDEGSKLVNPDGPEAATALQSQAAELTRLRAMCDELAEIVLFYAIPENWHGVYMCGAGPMTDDWSDDYDDDQYPDGKPGKLARTAYAKYQQEQGR